MRYRPSRGFILTVLPLAALVVCLGFGLLPELEEIRKPVVPGEISFKHEKPRAIRTATVPFWASHAPRGPLDWLEEGYESVMRWEYNPWKTKPLPLFDHYFKLMNSKDPLDQAKIQELQRLAAAMHQKLLLRFPELAVELRHIPDDRNAFLKWLELRDRFKVDPDSKKLNAIEFPKELGDYLNQKGPWNAAAAQAWLDQQKPLVDEIREIGLMPDRSVNGIPVDRWAFTDSRFAKSCDEILSIEARLAAERGDTAAALESVRAATGFADLFTDIETPNLLGATVQILLRRNLEKQVLTEIIPLLPPDQVDPAAWQVALNPTVHPPAEFARLMKGEWSTGTREFLLPLLLDSENPRNVPDAGDLVDFYSMSLVESVRNHESASLAEMPNLDAMPMADAGQLSRSSREAVSVMFIGATAWRKGWDYNQSGSALTQAAFAIMKGEPIPKDPVYGLDYVWDPVTRRLSMPAGKAFDDSGIKPITVPGAKVVCSPAF